MKRIGRIGVESFQCIDTGIQPGAGNDARGLNCRRRNRAAGRSRDSDDLAQLLRLLPATSTLRGNAAAKRALWPQLRRLRRSDPP